MLKPLQEAVWWFLQVGDETTTWPRNFIFVPKRELEVIWTGISREKYASSPLLANQAVNKECLSTGEWEGEKPVCRWIFSHGKKWMQIFLFCNWFILLLCKWYIHKFWLYYPPLSFFPFLSLPMTSPSPRVPFLRFMTLGLYCVPFPVTIAICLTIGLEPSTEAWWGHYWVYNWREWLPSSLSSSAVREETLNDHTGSIVPKHPSAGVHMRQVILSRQLLEESPWDSLPGGGEKRNLKIPGQVTLGYVCVLCGSQGWFCARSISQHA